MAPGAVDAVDVAVADRNGAPTVSGTISDRTFAPGDAALTIDLTSVFSDPDNDTLTYTVRSSDNARLSVSAVTGTSFTLTPVSPGRMVVAVVAADPEGLIAVLTFGVTVTVGNRDYDSDDDGLIDVGNLAQLNAMRYDLNGDGSTDEPTNWSKYHLAFVEGSWDMGCLDGCIGYELTTNLDFDTDGDGDVDSSDDYWNSGHGWVPIRNFSSNVSRFATIFEGNGRTITNLFIDSSENNIGLFGATGSSAVIRNLEMVSVQVTGTDDVGGLVGSNGGAVSGSFTTGKVSGDDDVGGLVGANLSDGAVSASYSTVQVTGDDRIGGTAGLNNGEVRAAYATGRVVGGSLVGGLIGWNTGEVNISYATGLVSSRSTVGGLVGRNGGGGNITDSYWDSDTSGHTTGSNGQAKNSEELQLPTTASDIYLNWNVDLDGDGMNDDPWDFGTSGQYPVLSVDTNGAGGATWQEFGQQLRTSPALMTTTALGRVTLTWSEVSSAVYNLYRTSGTTIAILSENTSSRSYVDTDVTAGATYVYQVAAVINGSEASRSPQVSVVVPMPGLRPTVTLQLMPTSISENGGSATVTARLSPVSTETTTVTVSATAVTPAVAGDFMLSANKTLMVAAGQAASTETVTITGNNNDVDAPNKTVMVMGTATNSMGVTGPLDVTLTIRDDDATPVVTTAALIPVAENETVVATLQATDEDDRTEDLEWDITGGNDRSQFTLTRGGELAFTAAKDYEEPDDSDRDRDYEVTVQVSDGANAVEADFTVRLQDVDDTAPTVSGIRISSNPGTDRTYAAGDEIGVTVTFSETVEVTGTPQLSLELGGGIRTATYEGGSGTAALVFAYKVADGESDTDGVGIEADSLSGGTIRDEAHNNAELDHDGLATGAGHKVDAVKPELAGGGGAVVDGATLTLTYGEPLDGSSTLAAGDFTVSGGDQARTVSNAAVSGSAVALTLDLAVEHGETGITVSYTPGTNPIRDVAGNDAEALSRESVTNETPDTTSPEVSSLAISSNPGSDQTYAAEDVIEVTATFSETVEVTGTPQLRLKVGSSNRTADYLRGTDTDELVFGYEVADGHEDTDGVSIEAGRIALSGGSIKDEADNDAVLDHDGLASDAAHKVDGVRPNFQSAAVDGSSLTLTYGETLDGGSRPAPGDFTVEVDGSGRSASGVSISGRLMTLTLSTAVEHGDTGIRVSYTPGTNPIQDAVGNDARGLSNQAVTNTTGAPNTAPEITTVGPFTVRENQTVVRRLAARDDDPGDEVTGWSIVGGADQSQFSITSDTGDLRFQEAPDYESPTDVVSGDPPSGAEDNEYVVTVEVRSGAGARELEAEQTFTLRVTDEREPPGVPEEPTFSAETAESLTVNWREPDNTGPAISDYDVRYREGSRGGFTDAQHMGPRLSLTLDDLEPGTAYEVQVRATNDEGTSDWSEPGEGMTVTPLTVEMIGGTEPPVEGPFTVRFSFSEPVRGFTQAAIEAAQDPACTDDQNNPVFCEPDIGPLETVDDRVFSTTVTPQTDRVAHNYTLTLTVSGGAVRSSVGNKPNEEAMLGGRVAPPGVTLPISEIGLRASGLDQAGRLNWNRPRNDGGSPIMRYEYRYAPVGEVWNDWENVGAGATGVTVGNLVNGLEYVFEMRAVNALGKGPVETAAAIPVRRTGPPPPPPPPPPPGPRETVPDAPINLLADGGDKQVALSWDAPEDDGGSAITDYEYRIDGRGNWISIDSTGTNHTITELVNGTTYAFQVRAVNAAGNSAPSNRAEATPGVGALDFAHFAKGAGITSALVLVNVAPHPIRPALYFYDKEGHPIDPELVVDLMGDLEVTEDEALTVRTEMEPLGELTISTHGRGELVTGSVKVASNGPIGGVLRFGLPDIGVAGVGASQPVRDAIFPARRQAGGISTAAAIHNLGEEAMGVSCQLMKDGTVLEEVEVPLEANGQEARYIEELFTGTDTSDFVGSVRCTAPEGGMFTGVAVELDVGNQIFTTLPVVPVARTGGGGQEAGLDFAHFANGAGIISGLVLVNRSTQPSGPGPTPLHPVILPSRPALYFYDKEGGLIDPESVVDVTGDLVVTEDGALSVRTEMEPLGELTISTHGRRELVTGSVKVISDGPIGGVLRFDLPGIGVAGVGTSQPVRDAIFPARRQAGEISTAAAIHNLGEGAMVVSCRLMKDGAALEEVEIDLEANGQEARYIEGLFTGTDTSDFVGSVRCTAPGEGMFTGVAVELDGGSRIFTTLPVVAVPERMSQE